ncbi:MULTISPECIES: hypothetical protein [unclassified Pseudomonas]|uniref:hypothetical protein n=1 Tax=unclassified Pseudomonas TaxID=196821 RepID=UPI000AAF87A5|nr:MULTISPECIES: hypothetical protein [unclassified Pseudomonas]QJI18899.1 hypothetical protein HKK57_11655 [Pseudomonas sp. ADAK21]QJI25943.1 hypothetical protein HKK56_21430 [Pseudomonas sp. ADAK20]
MSNIGSVSGYNFQPYEGVGYKEKDIARPNKLDLTAGEDAQVLDPRTGTWGPAVAADEGQQRDPGEPIDVEFVYDSKTGEYVLAKPVDPLIDLKHGQLIDVEIPHDPTGLYGSTPDKNETDKPASTHRTHLSSIR